MNTGVASVHTPEPRRDSMILFFVSESSLSLFASFLVG